jgi:F-box-like
LISIDELPDDVLLAVFYIYVDEDLYGASSKKEVETWQTLVHVCRRWRTIVFESPRHLKLRLACTPETPVRDLLDVWPALPLSIWGYDNYPTGSVGNITAVLQHNGRVCQIHLEDVPRSHLENISAAMQVPFPELTHLALLSNNETAPVLPDSFLGGSAQRLEFFLLRTIPFPGFPKLLLSATHLNDLRLFDMPHSGYIPPEVMVTALSVLTDLKFLQLGFKSPLSRPDRASQRLPPSTRTVLPVLGYFSFNGVSEYLDDFVSRIDVPRIDQLSINLLINENGFDTPQFIQFISRTPRFKMFKRAHLSFEYEHARVELFSETPGCSVIDVSVPCRELDWQVSSLEQVVTSCFPSLFTLEVLRVSDHPYSRRLWQYTIENALWLGLLLPFSSVKNLYLSRQVTPHIGPALQELVGIGTTEVLPALQNIFLEELQPSGPAQEGIGKFVAMRQVASHPIAVSRWQNPPWR